MNILKGKQMKVVLWSYSDEGKTALLYRGFKGNKDNQEFYHTVGFNMESIGFNGINIIFIDIGGACKIKDLRNQYLPNNDAIIFLIDSSLPIDDFIHTENIKEFQRCISLIENIPLLIAITKIDIRKISTLDIINAYQLQNLFQRKKKFGIIECSSFTREGIKEIKYWLSSIVKK